MYIIIIGEFLNHKPLEIRGLWLFYSILIYSKDVYHSEKHVIESSILSQSARREIV